MGVRTFMVHEGPDYEFTDMVRSYCSVSDCRRKHVDENGARRHLVAKAWTMTVNDIIRDDTNEVVKEHTYSIASCAVPGAMFWWGILDERADRHESGSSHFASGPQLCVILPNNQLWNIDGRASNCTMPDDFDHRCWVRHGDPPNVTVDKDGVTCAAGGGSILSGDYHGFLRNGELT